MAHLQIPVTKPEQHTFDLAGESFTAKAKISFKKWKALFSADDGAGTSVVDFIRAVLVNEDKERFDAVLDRDEDTHDDFATDVDLDNVFKALLMAYAGKDLVPQQP